jgi:hypothetical protein
MALNFGVLDQGGPSNFFEGYSQGQEKMQANAMAQQKAAQAQQEFGMRQQEFAAGQADKQRVAKAAAVTQKLASYEEGFLKAPNPDAARRLIQMQYADPDIGPIRSRFGSLEQALAEVPDEPTAFQGFLNQEAMGIKEFRKQKYRESQVAGLLGDGAAPAPTNAMAPAGAMPQAAPVANAMAPAAPNVADLVSRRNKALAMGEPAIATALNSDIARLSPAAGAPSPLARLQSELAALPPGDPRRADYVAAIRKETQFAPPASTTVVMPVQEKAEKGARGTMLVDEFKGISATARNAAKNLPTLETQERILEGGFKTGFGTDAQKAGASILSALGVPEATTYAAKAETFNAAANNAVLQKQLEQKGTQSQSDADRMEKTVAQLGNTVDGNKFIISVAKAQLKRDIEQRNFYSSWWNKNKTYDGAEEAWFSGEGDKSLFERPELKKYAAPQAAPRANKPAAAGGHPADIQAIIEAQKRR